MKIESHLENLKESVKEIDRVITRGLEENQRTLGFHASAGAIDMLEIIFHKHNLVDMGFILKHEWFNSKNTINEKLNFEFPQKEKILPLIMKIESFRTPFCYGKRRKENELEEIVLLFNELREIFREASQYEI